MCFQTIKNLSGLVGHIISFLSGPQENPDDCGTPILCMFYGLLLGILALTIYTTIKVMVLTKFCMVTTHNKHNNEKYRFISPLADQPILVTGHNGVDDVLMGLTDHAHVHREHYLVFCLL